MKESLGKNAIYIWQDSALYIGTDLHPHIHSHSVIECVIPLEGRLQLQQKESNRWQPCSAAIIDANQAHRLSVSGGRLASLYLEKTSLNYRQLVNTRNTGPNGAILLNSDASDTLRQALLNSMATPLENDDANAIRRELLGQFQGIKPKPKPLDPRLAKVIKQIQTFPDHKWNTSELAAVACLSPSRLQHLFKQHIGIPIRRYLLWYRLRLAIGGILEGRGLADTSQAAGFSDSAHFSRTCKGILGVAPSKLLHQSNNINVVLCQ